MMDELEVDFAKMVAYSDKFILPLENQRDEDDWQRASPSK